MMDMACAIDLGESLTTPHHRVHTKASVSLSASSHLLKLVRRVLVAVLLKDRGEGGAVGVHGVEPGVERAGVQAAAEVPALVHDQVVREEEEELGRRAAARGGGREEGWDEGRVRGKEENGDAPPRKRGVA
jgi:hypothetical protein